MKYSSNIIFTHRTAQLIHERCELAAELAAHTDEGQLALLTGRHLRASVRLEDLLNEGSLTLQHQRFERVVQSIVVFLYELRLYITNQPRHIKYTYNTHKSRIKIYLICKYQYGT